MAVAEMRDHVLVCFVDGTVTYGGGRTDAELRVKTIRWVPNNVNTSVTVDRVKEDGSTETVWSAVTTTDLTPQESRLDIRFTRGCVVTFGGDGGFLYLYGAL